MKKSDFPERLIIELDKFGANTWFIEELFHTFLKDPLQVPDKWRYYFNNLTKKSNQKEYTIDNNQISINYPQPENDDKVNIIAGSFAKILDNMNNSLTIPTATSQRSIPVKLLEENRIIINKHLQKYNLGKISFTHLIAWAIIKSVKKHPLMNCAFSIVNKKPVLINKAHINLGIAIDLEKKDGSHSLIVPNIKNCETLDFKSFFLFYEDLINRSRNGTIDPLEFYGTTITLTNTGTIGTLSSIPRLMIGQGAIIASGAIRYPVEYEAMSPSMISTLGISKVLHLTSTYDHRIIQGAESGSFLNEIHKYFLGENEFFEEIFNDLNIPAQPLQWQSDYQPAIIGSSSSNFEEIEKQARVLQLINIYRVRGHLTSNLDPLGSYCPYHQELDPYSYKFTIWDLDREFITGGFGGLKTASLRQILDILQQTYCNKIGVEYMHIQNPVEKLWLQSKMEPVRNIPSFSKRVKQRILEKLITTETFEHYIHNKFVGHKRFSLEGSETLIPVLDFLLNEANAQGIFEVVFGMAHRGRLNVLANIIGKSFESIFSEFEDIVDPQSFEGSGDVKYHLGATGKYKTQNGSIIDVAIASNPSHLEWVDPVVEGIVRAKQTRLKDNKEHKKVMPVLIHGDAAFTGQGIVTETLNLSQLSGYRTGGTIHIIINNQIGFTTTPEEARSSVYATDVAKMIQIPIFHVNGDDPEASLWVTKIAFEYRQIFHKDVVIDLFGYRKYGHNESDEPGFTQPILYNKIKTKNSVMNLYKDELLKEHVLTNTDIEKMKNDYINKLDLSFNKLKSKSVIFNSEPPLAISREEIKEGKKDYTFITYDIMKQVVNALTKYPEDFNIHPKLKNFIEKRVDLLEENGLADWALGEALAFGSLLLESFPVRLSGQDSVRGTFSQRHLALSDVKSGNEYISLNHISDDQSKLEAIDSSLSEAAVLGFEYGYSMSDPLTLVLWEAQFGDFSNGAQIIIDNFITVSNVKWQQPNKVVLLLPHGYEGQGPEHSSARLERFLTLSAENNIQVCNVTTPSQYFHLLRRQVLVNVDLPLIIMTPKSLLRHSEAKSKRDEFLTGGFIEILDDNSVVDKNKIKKLLLHSGKVFYDLNKYRKEHNITDTALIRFEQLYPFNIDEIKNIISSYKNLEKIIWVQEEPKNMGAFNFVKFRIFDEFKLNKELLYSGRPESASPALGSNSKSNSQQMELVGNAFRL